MRGTTTPPPQSARTTPVAGIALAVYVAALVYASLYPFRGWRTFGWSGLHFLTEPWPRYWTWFDVFSNVLVYMPGGALLVGVLHRRLGTSAAVLAGALAGALLSLGLESLQAFLPGRVPSRLDWLTNTVGAALGAGLAAVLRARRGDDSGFAWHRTALLRPHAVAVIALIGAWLIAQIHPQRALFGTGDLLQPLIEWMRSQASLVPVERGDAPVLAQVASALLPWLDGVRIGSAWSVLLEAIVTGATVVAIGLLIADTLLPEAPRALVTGFVIGTALVVKHAADGWLVGTQAPLAWLTAGAQAGLVVGVVALGLLSTEFSRARLWVAIAALAIAALASNLLPVNTYHASMLQQWDQGAWRNFNGLMRAFALLWPYAAMTVLLARLLRQPSRGSG